MAAVPLASSFLAGSLLTILIPLCLLIGIAIWQVRAIMHVPGSPSETAAHAAGPAELEGRGEGQEPANGAGQAT